MSRPQSPYRPTRRASRTQQRGVAAVLVGIMLVALVTVVMLGFNIGQLYFAKRTLEGQATLAALAASQVASGCRNGGVPGAINPSTLAPSDLSLISAAVANSLAQNPSSDGVTPTASIFVGTHDQTTGYNNFQNITSMSNFPSIDSVRVVLTRQQPAVIAANLFSASGKAMLTASAFATQSAVADFDVGSTLASVNTNQASLLNALLPALLSPVGLSGTSLSLGAVDYSGLAQANVTLAGLMAAAGVTDLTQLLNANINSSQAVGDLKNALTGTVSVGTGNALTSLASGAATTGGNVLADIIGNVGQLNPGINDALAQVPFSTALNLLEAIAEDSAAHSGKLVPIAIPAGLAIPGVNLGATLSVLQAPQAGMGSVGMASATAHTAQIVIDIDAQVGGSTGTFIPALVGSVAQVNLAVRLAVAPAIGTLANVSCPSATSGQPSAQVAVGANVLTLTLGAVSSGTPPQPPTSGKLISIANGLVNVSVSGATAPVSIGTGSGSPIFGNFVLPPAGSETAGYGYTAIMDVNNPYTVSSSATNLASSLTQAVNALTANLQASTVNIPLIGAVQIPVGQSASILTNLLTAPLPPVNGNPVSTPTSVVSGLNSILSGVLSALGIQAGQATVIMNSVTIAAPLIGSFCSPSTPCYGVPAATNN